MKRCVVVTRCVARCCVLAFAQHEFSVALQLFGHLKQAGGYHADRCDQADPDADAAAGEEEVFGDLDETDQHEDRRAERRARS